MGVSKHKLNMGNKSGYDEYAMQVADFEKIKEMKLILKTCNHFKSKITLAA
jgi:hypothetical protein